MAIAFTKYHGLGNDFILVDNRHQNELVLTPEDVIKGCDRHFGIGADGIMMPSAPIPKWRSQPLITSSG
ncbi:MAG: hypothetical protein AAFQ89_20385, partial [Cyanobacteria bacterium J06626_18]